MKHENDSFDENEMRQFLIDEQDSSNTQAVILAGWLNQLESRIALVEQYNLDAYYKLLNDGNSEVDSDSIVLIDQIADYIRKNIGDKEAQLLFSKSGLTLTTVQSQFGDWHRKTKQVHQTSVDYLKHWARQLKQLIEKF